MLYGVLASFAAAFIVSVLLGKPVIKKLRKLKFGQIILEDGPKWHLKKGNVPTMGGFIFISGITAAMILMLILFGVKDSGRWIMVLVMAYVYGCIGVIDDWCKMKKKQNKGLSAKAKFALQLAAAIVFITVLRVLGYIEPVIAIPFFNVTWKINWIIYFVFTAFVIVGMDNAVNLTDGLDGLASSVTLIVMIFFTASAMYLAKNGDVSMEKLAYLPAAAAGGLAAFLIFNFNPAKVFMGDTGSLYLGGLVAGLAFAIETPLILVTVGLWYIIETLSVIMQVGYFKLTHGKRIFKMAPIHHHFELCGYSEKQIVFGASAITLVLSVLSYFAITWLYPLV